MATLTVRKVDDDLYERLRVRARARKRSLEAEIRIILAEAEPEKPKLAEVLERLQEHRERMFAKYGLLSDSTDIIRQMRDEE